MFHSRHTRTRLSRLSPAPGLRERLSDATIDELLLAAPPTEAELAWSSVAFRRRLLDACGFDADGALALRPEIGLQEVLELVKRGCPPATAVRILV